MLLKNTLGLLGLLLGAGLFSGCDAVVGANCSIGLDPCGPVCCAPGAYCTEQLTCELGVPTRNPFDGGPPAPWDGGPAWDGGPTDGEPKDGGDGGDVGPRDSEPRDGGPKDSGDAGPLDSGDAGPPDSGDAGTPDSGDAGTPDSGDAGTPDSGDAGTPDGGDAGTPDSGDAGTPDGGDAGTVDGGDAGTVDGGDAGTVDGGPICPIGTQLCSGQCFDTQTSTLHCGTCNTACGANEFCNAGVCAPTCTTPRTQCPGGCFYVQNDPHNCGSCGVACGSNVCYQGGCVAPSAGHVIVIGHDMRSTHPATVNIAGNAVFLPVQAMLTVGRFRARTDPATEAAIDGVISTSASQLGRSFTAQTMPPTEVTQRLASVDVFVIYPQEGATDFELRTWGTDWSLALQGFVRRGGTIVLFDAGGAHRGAWQILDTAGLFPASARTTLAPGTALDVVSPADALVRGAPLSYPAPASTMTFTSTLTDVVVETRAMPSAPVIFHRVILP